MLNATIEKMPVSMDWVCILKQDGKYLHTALGKSGEIWDNDHFLRFL